MAALTFDPTYTGQVAKSSVTVGSLEEVKPCLRQLANRYELHAFDKIKVQ